MATPPRYPIEILRRLAPPVPVRFAGRVTSVTPDGRAVVVDMTGRVEVSSSTPPPVGAWIVASGNWNGAHVDQAEIELLNTPSAAFPRRDGDWRWLNEDQGRRRHNLIARSEARAAIREFFSQRAFIEVETPAMVPSPGLDTHLDAYPVAGENPARWLMTSPEYQMKRILAAGLARVYQMAPAFRRGEQGQHHEPEFCMLEWYRAFSGANEVMRDTEELVAHVSSIVRKGSRVIPAGGVPVDVTPPWDRLTVDEAFRQYAGCEVAEVLGDGGPEGETRFFDTLANKVQPQLGRFRPVFLTHWPASMASLARLHPDDPSYADRFEAYVDGIELCNGYGELIDPAEQRRRLLADQAKREELGLPVYPIDERFLAALEEGMPPAGGNALGVDRLVMLLLGEADIADVLAIPSSRL